MKKNRFPVMTVALAAAALLHGTPECPDKRIIPAVQENPDPERSLFFFLRTVFQSGPPHGDVLCVNMVDRSAASGVIDKAMEADIPIVFFNREPVSEDMNR